MIAMLKSWWHNQRLATKHAVILLAAMFTVIPAIYFSVQHMGQAAFLDIEAKTVEAQSKRAKHALKVFEDGLLKSLSDYSNWDDSLAYIANPSVKFEESTLNPLTFKSMGVDYVTYVRFDGKVVFQRAVDISNEKILIEEGKNLGVITSKGAFFEAAKKKDGHVAYVSTPRGVYILYSMWVKNSAGEGNPIGFMVMGNLLHASALSDALQSDVKLERKVEPALAGLFNAKTSAIVTETQPGLIKTHIGIFGADASLLGKASFETPRSLMIAGKQALLFVAVSLAAGMLVLVWFLVWGVRKISVGRLQRLEELVRHYEDGARAKTNDLQGRDEIASLNRAFDDLATQLREASEELSKRAYLQGKADSAAGMLHNVRNALAPIRVMQEKWLREDTLPYRANMQKAAEELLNDDLDPARRADLERFLMTAARKLALSHAGRVVELEESRGSINQIAEILSSYNFDTSGDEVGDMIDTRSVIDASRKNLDALEGIQVQFDIANDLPAVRGNRVHLSQVIDNILVNAREAMIAQDIERPTMVVFTKSASDGTIEFHFRDNGDGIAAENLNNAFQRGYSTREHKAGGLGLHWSANVMRAMGGAIRLESEGKGLGATAILTLQPVVSEEQQLAA